MYCLVRLDVFNDHFILHLYFINRYVYKFLKKHNIRYFDQQLCPFNDHNDIKCDHIYLLIFRK